MQQQTSPLPDGPAEDDVVDAKYLQRILKHLRETPENAEDVLRFMTFAMPLAKASSAQLFQDLWAVWTSGCSRDGYFVEFGAFDGVYLSNTLYLEREMGWTGVIAEPNPAYAEALPRERSCAISTDCVYSQSGMVIDFLATAKGEFSRIASIVPEDNHEARRVREPTVVPVKTISLNDLLIQFDAPRRIDFMSVDTEGSELEILSAFDFERWDVRAIAVEHNWTSAREKLFDLLCAKGYRRPWPRLSRFDDWYVKAT